jgi:DNA repair protein SbcC/Rad50
MFGFLFKRTERVAPQPAVAPQAALRAEAKQVSDQARQQALQQAQTLTDEAAAVAFILQSAFADARLAAAQQVQSPPALEQVLQACRNTDRRVAKLMQARLDNVRQQQVVAGKAAACIAQAQRLQQERQLMPNQVAELDRSWDGKDVPSDLQQQFTQLRATLADRLSAQASLQQHAMGLLNTVKAMHLQAKTDASGESESLQALDALDAQMASCISHAEALTLPRHLANDFAQEAQTLRKLLVDLQQHQSALLARSELLANWEAATESLHPDALKSAWSALPRLPAALLGDALEQRYQALLKQHAVVIVKPQKTQVTPTVAEASDRPQIAEALDGLEKALEEGALQLAVDFDKTLRAMDFKSHKPSATQTSRLVQARSELTRLQGWARWGGNVSREELTKAALELPVQALAPAELAKKIGSLRARWKSLDVSSGSAPKVLWDGFDAACTAAYAPVAAHFQQQAEQRQVNQVNARALIEELQLYAQTALATDATGSVTPDWKVIAQFCQQKQQAWKNLGAINRSEKKSLDSAFAGALQTLLAPLAGQQALEVARREKLITEAAELPANQRDTADRVKELQARWQEQAKALPLPRQEEQELWQRFRSACDAIFAQRKEAASSADAERRDNLRLREEQCTLLEAALTQSEAGLAKVLQQAQQEWNRGGQVPRASQAQIDARFQVAVAAVQAILDQSRHLAALAQADALRVKLVLCQKIEAGISISAGNGNAATGSVDVGQIRAEADWRSDWQALPPLAPAFEKILAARFERALQNSGNYAATLEAGRPLLQQELLRAEILAGSDSPAAFSRERLQLQVEVLRASLKAGAAAKNIEQQLLHICDLPALMDDAALQRLLKLLAQL